MRMILRIYSEKVELEVQEDAEGSIADNLDQIKNMIKSIREDGLLLQEMTKAKQSLTQQNPITDVMREKEEEEIPLDLFLQKYDADDSQPQKRTLAVGLYLTTQQGMVEFKSKEINEILSANRLSTIDSISTHARRLRSKGFVSIKSSNGKEIIIRINKTKIEEIEEYLKGDSD